MASVALGLVLSLLEHVKDSFPAHHSHRALGQPGSLERRKIHSEVAHLPEDESRDR